MSKTKKAMPTWIHATHYHCKRCGNEIKFLARFYRPASIEEFAIGECKNGSCDKLMIEYAYSNFFNKKIKWINNSIFSIHFGKIF